MNLTELQSILGWCAVINYGVLLFSALLLMCFRNQLTSLIAKLYKINASDSEKTYFQFLAIYKGLTLFFNLVPYIAIRLIA